MRNTVYTGNGSDRSSKKKAARPRNDRPSGKLNMSPTKNQIKIFNSHVSVAYFDEEVLSEFCNRLTRPNGPHIRNNTE